jgi:hypothetical protein
MTIDLQACYKRNESFVYREVAGETVLVPIRASTADLDNLYVLNEVGARIWEQLDGESSLETILGTIRTEYEVARDTAEQDLAEFVESLDSLGAIELA